MQKGTYLAILFSLVVHGIILLLIITTQSNQQKPVKEISHPAPIKSFIYYAPSAAKPLTQIVKKDVVEKLSKTQNIEEKPLNNDQPKANSIAKKINKSNEKTINKASNNTLIKPAFSQAEATTNNSILGSTTPPPETKPSPEPIPLPKNKKLDSFTQLQRLRSQLKNKATLAVDNPYQDAQPPSIFNPTVKAVPHSVPLKDEEKIREQNTKNMGAGIAITKGEDGLCSVTQDMSAYGLSEGSSTQFFNCGESNFDKSFREHMQAVKAKLGKK